MRQIILFICKVFVLFFIWSRPVNLRLPWFHLYNSQTVDCLVLSPFRCHSPIPVYQVKYRGTSVYCGKRFEDFAPTLHEWKWYVTVLYSCYSVPRCVCKEKNFEVTKYETFCSWELNEYKYQVLIFYESLNFTFSTSLDYECCWTQDGLLCRANKLDN